MASHFSPTALLHSPALAAFCEARGIRTLSLFGSRLHGSARDESDIDLLVEFLPQQRVTLFDMADGEEALTEMLGRRVDLRTAEDLSHRFRHPVVAEAQTLYRREA